MDNIEAIIFDMDGVIFDTERLYLNTWKKVFERYGYKMTKETYTSVMGVGRKNVIKTFLKIYGENLPIERMYKEKDYELGKLIEGNKVDLKIGVYETLSFLKENGYKIALATSAKSERAKKHLIHAKIIDKFDVIICGDDVVKSKPDPEIFLKAVNALGVNKNNCVIIEDSEAGVQSGYNAGIKVIHVPDLKELDNKSKKYVHRIVSKLEDIIEYLEVDYKQIS